MDELCRYFQEEMSACVNLLAVVMLPRTVQEEFWRETPLVPPKPTRETSLPKLLEVSALESSRRSSGLSS